MLINISSYLTLGVIIGAILSLVLKDIFTRIFKAIAKPIQKKEYGLRCDEIRLSAYPAFIPMAEGEELNLSKSLSEIADTLKKVTIPKKYVFVDTVLQITNTGKNDIIKEDVLEPLTIKVPKPFIIANYNPTPSNNQIVITNAFVDEKKRDAFTSSWNLLKAGDYYNINIVALAPAEEIEINKEQIEDSFFNSLDIKIYAKNIDKISKSQNVKQQDKLGLIFGFFAILLFFGILMERDSKYHEELSPICYTIETNNPDTITLYQDGIIKYDPSINSINFNNDSISFNMSLEDFENNMQIKAVKIDKDTISIIHSHWIKHKVLKKVSKSIIALSLLISLALLLYHYIRNVK